MAQRVLDIDSKIFVGKIIKTFDFIKFHAESVLELIDAFHVTVDEYLEACEYKGRAQTKSLGFESLKSGSMFAKSRRDIFILPRHFFSIEQMISYENF